MSRAQTIDLGYCARPHFIPFHRRLQRWSALVCHRRAGKTVACVADLNDDALRCTKKDGRFGYVAPYFAQAKDIAWTYLKNFACKVPGAQINESELRVDYAHNGARVRLYGADNADRMRGLYFDGVVLDEPADMRPSVWPEIIRPTLSDREGWAAFIGTPKGRNDFFDIYDAATKSDAWFSMMLRASESGLLPAAELEDARRIMTPEQYEQEYECSFDAAILGAYYGKELAELDRLGRICELPYERDLPVHTAWDIGVGDSTAIWFFQVVASEIRVIDFYENSGHGVPHYVSVLADRPYRYGDHWLPHDAKVREWGSGRSRVETLIAHNIRPRLIPQHREMDGINAARLTLSMCFFDRYKCADGVEALRQFKAHYDEKTKAFRETPFKDWTNHAADAFRYLAMAWRELAPAAPARVRKPELSVGSAGPRMDDLVTPLHRLRPREDGRV